MNPALEDVSLEIQKGQFVVLFGASGSGKSTLLRLLKKEIQPYGRLAGEIIVNNVPIQENQNDSCKVGFVFQDPENQVVAHDALHEIAFGLENMGLSTTEMRNRIAEMVHFFGVESLLSRQTHQLSGGRKQQINLASVLLMQPDLLLLDEPTAQLDPVSARELIDMLVRLNEEFGMTIVVAEHRLEEMFTCADRVVMLEKGRIKQEGNPEQVIEAIWESYYQEYVPSIPKLFLSLPQKQTGKLPLTVKEGRTWVQSQTFQWKEQSQASTSTRPIQFIEAKDISFSYELKGEKVLRNLNFSLYQGEFFALLGGNGSGKSTFLKMLGNLLTPIYGKIYFQGRPIKGNNEMVKKLGYLPQNPKLFFLFDTVEEELRNATNQWNKGDFKEAETLLEELGISHIIGSHPYDLSGGELQKAALACILMRKPEILLLDEPTKGLDPVSKHKLASILGRLKSEGMTIMMSTHDVEFAAQYATRCGMMFQGQVTSEGNPREFFKGNFFYTTMIQRLFMHEKENQIVTLEEAVRSWVNGTP